MRMDDPLQSPDPATPQPDLSTLVISLLKGVLYRETDERLWETLNRLQAQVRDYVAVLGLDLVVDEAEGYAFLKSRPEPADAESAPRLPRLIARRPLSFPVSLLLALLRRKLAEFDAGGGDTRLILSREEIVELIRVFLPESSNEVRLLDQIETHINKVVELGFLYRLKGAGGPPVFEVRRVIKAFVDAQWLADFEQRLVSHQAGLAESADGEATGDRP